MRRVVESACTQFHVHKLCIMNIIILWFLCDMFISQLISILYVVDIVSADSKSQSATTPTATPPSTDATSQHPGE